MASYQVSGAGSTFVNGTYAENGTYNGYPNYEYVSGGTTYKLQYPNSAIGWVLTDGNTTYYTGKGGTTPDTVTSWSVGLGISPAPTVTKVADSSGGSTGGTDFYIVSGAGSSENNGTYTYLNDYNSKPRYQMLDSAGMALQIRYEINLSAYGLPAGGWVLSNPGGYPYVGTGDMPDTATWNVGPTGQSPVPTFTKGGSAGGGDSDGTTIAGYRVSGAGNASANGEYLPQGEYNGKPLYYYAASSLYLRWSGSNWQITTVGASSATATPQYYNNNNGATPDVGTWVNVVGAAPAPTVTVIEGAGDSGGGVVDPEDTTIIVPDSTPEVGEKGLKVGNMFIPVCPNPVDTHLSKVSDTGKNIALGWLGFGDGVDIAGLDVQFQALTDGWLSAHVTATAGGQYLELLVYRGDNDSEHRYGNTRYSYSSGDLRAMMFVPRGMFYKVRSNATLVKALWLPCNGASE